MCLLYCSLCKKRSAKTCSNCETFPQVRNNLPFHDEDLNLVIKTLTNPKNKFPQTTSNKLSKGPLC